jgi:CheY-like chemotaxis protein
MDPIVPKTVLYIEDSGVSVFLVEAIFAPLSAQLLIAGDGSTGLELARRHRPHLILLDMNLPDMDGIAFLKLLRGDPAIASIPVVIASADELLEERKHLAALGVTEYLLKPFDLDEFERLVGRYVGTAKSQRP